MITPLNDAFFDWFTVTSFDRNFYEFWSKKIKGINKIVMESRMMQYEGVSVEVESGTIKLMSGLQKGTNHHMLMLSSTLAEMYSSEVLNQVKQGIARVTRIDIQCTVWKTDEHDMFDIFCNMKGDGQNVSWIASKDKKTGHELETIGKGARSSDRYTRIYTKLADDGLLLRFETEFKGDRARAVVRAILDEPMIKYRALQYEVERTRDGRIQRAFHESLLGLTGKRIRVAKRTATRKTERWLLYDVLPVLSRTIHDHDSDGSLWAAFYNQIMLLGKAKGMVKDE